MDVWGHNFCHYACRTYRIKRGQEMTKLKNISIGSYLFSFLFLLFMGIGFLCNKDTDLHGAGIAAVLGITFVGCIPFAYIVNKLYCKLDNRNCEKYSKISFKKIFLILMICYTIFFISIFPEWYTMIPRCAFCSTSE